MALLTDRFLGEPQRYHPLVIWGDWVITLEKRYNSAKKWQGVLAWCVVVMPVVIIVYCIEQWLQLLEMQWLRFIFSVYCLYFSMGWQSLIEHGRAVNQALSKSITAGRDAVARIVSRDTVSMDEPAVIKATVESVLENGADAIFAPLFWFVIGGPVAVITYRLANTLDAMWGYRTQRFNNFGWFSAKVDDVLNFIPARLTAISYTLLGDSKTAWQCWRGQAKHCASPNGGPVMCAGAGSLGIELGGPTTYHGECIDKPIMGQGRAVMIGDITRAIQLMNNSVYLWLTIICLWGLLIA